MLIIHRMFTPKREGVYVCFLALLPAFRTLTQSCYTISSFPLPFEQKMEEEEGGTPNPFANIEKSAVMQESRKFNAMPIKPRECSLILAKIMYVDVFLRFFKKKPPRNPFTAMGESLRSSALNLLLMYWSMKPVLLRYLQLATS